MSESMNGFPESRDEAQPGAYPVVDEGLIGCVHRGIAAEWLEMMGKSDRVMYGSSYPHRNMAEIDAVSMDLTDEQRQKVLWRNADALYGVGLTASCTEL